MVYVCIYNENGLFCLMLEIFHQYIPYGDDVADAAGQDEEMENTMHVTFLVERIEYRTGNIGHTFSNNPYHSSSRYGVDQWLECHKNRKAHAYEAKCLQIRMLLELDETDGGADYGTKPHKGEQRPSPVALAA